MTESRCAGASAGLCRETGRSVRPALCDECRTDPAIFAAMRRHAAAIEEANAHPKPDPIAGCPKRGAQIGTRACPACRGRVEQKVYACPDRPEGVTIKDCQACLAQSPAADPRARVQEAAPCRLRSAKPTGSHTRESCGHEVEIDVYGCPHRTEAVELRECEGCPLRVDAERPDVGRCGVVIPARNEGWDVAATIADLRAATPAGADVLYVVIDDGSDKAPPAGLPDDVVVVRHEAARGEGYSRNEGMGIAFDRGCDAAVVMDAHMRAATDDPVRNLCRAALRTGGVVCAVTHNVYQARDFRGYGGRLAWNAGGDGGAAGLRTQWGPAGRDLLWPVQTVYGASYCAGRDTWRWLGGYLDLGGAHGYGEPSLAIASYFLDVPHYCHTGVHLRHRFRVRRPYASSHAHYWLNYACANRVLFRPDVYDRVFAPVAGAHCKHPHLSRFADDPVLSQRRDRFASHKAHDDEECLDWLQIEPKTTRL